MNFLNPIYFWTFLGLLVPLAIHLWSKQRVKVIKVGSIQFLEKKESKKARSLRLNELFLLILRLLLLSLLTLILAEPILQISETNSEVVYFVEPELFEDDNFQSVLDTLTEDEVRLLAQGFPMWNKDASNEEFETSNYWHLTDKLENYPADSIVIFSKGYQKKIKGKRPTITKNLNWVLVGDDKGTSKILQAYKVDDSIQLKEIRSTSDYLNFSVKKIASSSEQSDFNLAKDSIKVDDENWLAIKKLDTIPVTIFSDDDFKGELLYIKASLKAITNYLEIPIAINEFQINDSLKIEGSANIIWLSEEIPPSLQARILVYKPNPFVNKLIEEDLDVNQSNLTKRLTPENIVSDNLSEALVNWLPLEKPSEDSIAKYDIRTVELAAIQPNLKEVSAKKSKNKHISLTKWIWLAFILTLILERIVSKLRKQ
ncbi:BatA domain-containing protein [Galbibacter mesophilus]|uniref:BatA domain-containing protein n=1 Tax=Galbibacter mesophilus TaxID=379069 RepID=UPI00191D84BA|nr:BatA domain-containing protein [Galbibacter mesophilus]MCM5662980.1 BatA domain-containing protein [Galbibacter mesophilus]